jgi:GntR family transcriptional regulator, transcriptional repressor for pyruvate dehydrogenase complex
LDGLDDREDFTVAAPLTEMAIDKIRSMIVGGDLPPGARLPPEQELASQLGSSRNTTREAVRALITARVLDVRRGDGTYVTSLRPELLLEGIGLAVELMHDENRLDLIEVRKALEPAATELAAQRIDEAGLARVEHHLMLMRESAEIEELVTHDADFHIAVAEAACNSTLASLLRGISSRTIRARVWHGILDEGSTQRTIAEHETIYNALVAGDIALARAAALVHVSTTESFVRRLVGQPPRHDER